MDHLELLTWESEHERVSSEPKRSGRAPNTTHCSVFHFIHNESLVYACTLIKLAELLEKTLSTSSTCPFLLVLVPPPVFAFVVPAVVEPLI